MARKTDPKNFERVLDAAATLFLDVGYDAASMQQLADRLGLHKSSLYHYVDSKEDLLKHRDFLKEVKMRSVDPDKLDEGDPSQMDFGSGGNTDAKAWKDIWGCGQGIGAVKEVRPAGELVARLLDEYQAARRRLQL